MARFKIDKGKLKVIKASPRGKRGNGGFRQDLGMYFRSAWESNVGRYLNFLKEHGAIENWEYETEEFWFEGIKRGTRSYKPDFKVVSKSGVEFWEVKGFMDAHSQTQLNRMKKYYPHITIHVIGKKEYTAIAKKVSGIIPGWERANRFGV